MYAYATPSAGSPPGTRPAAVVALAAATGSVQWTTDVGEPLTWGLTTASGGLVLATSIPDIGSGHLHALEQSSGRVRWSMPVAQPSAPAVVGTTVYVAARNRVVYAISAASGTVRWQKSLTTTSDVIAPLAVGAGVVVIAAEEEIFALDGRTGNVRWHVPQPGLVHAAPVIDGGRVYVANDARLLRVLALATGAEQLSIPLPGVAEVGSPVVARDSVYLGVLTPASGPAHVIALDAMTGKTRWTALADAAAEAPTLAGRYLYCRGSDGRIRAVATADGSTAWDDLASPDVFLFDEPVIAGGRLYTATADGALRAYRGH